MKKILLLVFVMFLGLSVSADEFEIVDLSSGNFWEKLGKKEQKVYSVGAKLLNANKLNKRVVFSVNGFNSANASASYRSKTVSVNKGLLNYIDNDDELAAILAHEIAHNIDYYDGFGKVIIMTFNSKTYEYQADTVGIDLMVKAGYNPIAMITVMNKISGESVWDWGILWSHPKTSSRLMNDYKYIYKKYPQYLSSDMTKNINYQNWVYTAQKDIKKFQQKQKAKMEQRGDL